MLLLNKEEKVQDALGVLPVFAVHTSMGGSSTRVQFTIYIKALTKDRALTRGTSMSIKECFNYLSRVYSHNYFSLSMNPKIIVNMHLLKQVADPEKSLNSLIL